MTITAGTKLGRYEIRSKIGEGGMGEVYLAQDTKLDRKVALKILPAEVASNKDRMRRFVQEAKAASALNHPNIITIYEVEQIDSVNFIATEFIDGETLRQRMRNAAIKLGEVLEVAIQSASALTAAHAANIIHRDIKPENIMLRRDGIVKVLDFGLAKLTEQSVATAIDTEAPTRALINTEPGLVMGTAIYMSPEQARGLTVDARTDIWSLGVLLYELVAGCLPFEGSTTSEILAAIINEKEPPPLARFAREVPAELERIVEKALRKDREERYQVIKDLLLDLKRLKHQLEFEIELERSRPPDKSSGEASVATAREPATETARVAAARTTSSVVFLISKLKRHKGAAAVAAAIVAVAAAAVFFYFSRATALTEKDTILLADFVNTTGDNVFDGTLKQALAVQLGQSPFLNIFPDDRIRETLRFMGRSPDDRVTKDVAREICERQGIKAMLTGTISSFGSSYLILLEATNARNAEAIAREQIEAGSKEQVISALGKAATRLREKLGESLSTIEKFDAPIDQATTSSLEALKAFSLGNEQHARGAFAEAIPFFKRAVELDPNFALAYLRLSAAHSNLRQNELAAEFTKKAFDLRDRTSEREKLYISSLYYAYAIGDLEKAIEETELWQRTYPRDYLPPGILSNYYLQIGQPEKAIEEGRQAIQINPNIVAPYSNMAGGFARLKRYEEAREVLKQAMEKKLETPLMRTRLYEIAFIEGDQAAMQQQLDWAKGQPNEYDMLSSQAMAAASLGQLRKSKDLSALAVDFAERRRVKELAAAYASRGARTSALFGDCRQVKNTAGRALDLARSREALVNAAFALALCGETSQTQSLIDESTGRFPGDTSFINVTWLPTIRAMIEINRNNPAQAIELLRVASRYELGDGANLFPAYVRGLAYLRQQAPAEAMAEFQKIVDHRGVVRVLPHYSLAYLGLARAAALQGDMAKSRKAYQDFFALWKDADPDVPILIEAKKEYEKLK